MEVFPEALAEAFLQVSRRLRSQTQRRMAPLGVNLHQSRALRTIAEHGPLRPSELAGRLGITPRSATDSVAPLVASGLVERRTDPEDGRAQLLALSSAGEVTLAGIGRARAEAGAELFGRLSPAEREALAALLDRLRAESPQGH
ncbi:MarR family winged helix-turn-helix transcriptional regulator [Propionicimonas sp.]|uniref:MarR family winged helix-turn-helix transcriptional regulator n=1 Tax=Propionicimonas sp. TaxID=1955623 RepID=UPI0039E3B720